VRAQIGAQLVGQLAEGVGGLELADLVVKGGEVDAVAGTQVAAVSATAIWVLTTPGGPSSTALASASGFLSGLTSTVSGRSRPNHPSHA